MLLKDFAVFVRQLAHEISEHAQAFAAERGRPYQYLSSGRPKCKTLAEAIREELAKVSDFDNEKTWAELVVGRLVRVALAS